MKSGRNLNLLRQLNKLGTHLFMRSIAYVCKDRWPFKFMNFINIYMYIFIKSRDVWMYRLPLARTIVIKRSVLLGEGRKSLIKGAGNGTKFIE